jgi:hypothetical protein
LHRISTCYQETALKTSSGIGKTTNSSLTKIQSPWIHSILTNPVCQSFDFPYTVIFILVHKLARRSRFEFTTQLMTFHVPTANTVFETRVANMEQLNGIPKPSICTLKNLGFLIQIRLGRQQCRIKISITTIPRFKFISPILYSFDILPLLSRHGNPNKLNEQNWKKGQQIKSRDF